MISVKECLDKEILVQNRESEETRRLCGKPRVEAVKIAAFSPSRNFVLFKFYHRKDAEFAWETVEKFDETLEILEIL